MGLEMSKAECNLHSRYFIGTKRSNEIITSCAKHKIFWFLGLTVILTVCLIAVYLSLRNNDGITALRVPLFIVFIPLALFIVYVFTIGPNSARVFKKESLEQELSGMDKKEFLTYKAGDDRARLGFLGSATSASILASSNVLGPYLRADKGH